MPSTAFDLVAEARARITEITSRDFFAEHGDSVLIDVREPAEFSTGHIEGAINIPRGVLEFEVDAHPAVGGVSDPALAYKNRPVVIYCRSGGRAALAAQSLQSMGFSNVCSLAGGIAAWTASGLPLSAR